VAARERGSQANAASRDGMNGVIVARLHGVGFMVDGHNRARCAVLAGSIRTNRWVADATLLPPNADDGALAVGAVEAHVTSGTRTGDPTAAVRDTARHDVRACRAIAPVQRPTCHTGLHAGAQRLVGTAAAARQGLDGRDANPAAVRLQFVTPFRDHPQVVGPRHLTLGRGTLVDATTREGRRRVRRLRLAPLEDALVTLVGDQLFSGCNEWQPFFLSGITAEPKVDRRGDRAALDAEVYLEQMVHRIVELPLEIAERSCGELTALPRDGARVEAEAKNQFAIFHAAVVRGFALFARSVSDARGRLDGHQLADALAPFTTIFGQPIRIGEADCTTRDGARALRTIRIGIGEVADGAACPAVVGIPIEIEGFVDLAVAVIVTAVAELLCRVGAVEAGRVRGAASATPVHRC
jgi:hypothetical protein